MKLFIVIALLFGSSSLVAATTIKGRTLKGSGTQSKKKKIKKSKDVCPKRTAYNAPAGCNDNCYSNMTELSEKINSAFKVPGPPGPTFTGTICSGTHEWPAAASVSGAVANAISTLDLSCCGSENSCVITGETPSVTRSTHLIGFFGPAHLILQGLSFVNITGTAALVYTTRAVVEVKNVMVDSVLMKQFRGGVFHFDTTQATINNSKFTKNQNLNSFGGAIKAYYSIIQMNGNVFVENHSGDRGGAVYINDGTLIATCNTFENNTAFRTGGAIRGDFPHLQLTNNQFLGNQANQGGAVLTEYQSLVSIGNNYKKNVAFEKGGAVSMFNVAGDLFDDRFTENSAPFDVRFEKRLL